MANNPAIFDQAVELSIPMNADHNGAVIDCRDFDKIMVTVEWASANATDGTFELQISNIATGNFEGYPRMLYNVLTASGAHHWVIDVDAIPFVRVKYAHGSVSAGLYAVTCWIKR